jgi:hypothetical protein
VRVHLAAHELSQLGQESLGEHHGSCGGARFGGPERDRLERANSTGEREHVCRDSGPSACRDAGGGESFDHYDNLERGPAFAYAFE